MKLTSELFSEVANTPEACGPSLFSGDGPWLREQISEVSNFTVLNRLTINR